MKGKNNHRYLVGYCGDNQCVYGNHEYDDRGAIILRWANPMTKYQAKMGLKKFIKYSNKTKVTIYKLVPVRLK